MSKHSKDALSKLMKKQMSEKSTKKTIISDLEAIKALKKDDDYKINNDELSEDELLKKAKMESISKANQHLNLELIKKLILQRIIKYGAIIIGSSLIAIAAITIGPAFLAFLKMIFQYLFMSSFE